MPWNLLIEAVGARVRIKGDSLGDAEREAVRTAWSDAQTPSVVEPPRRRETVVDAPGGEDIAHLLAGLSQRVTLAAIEAQQGRCWMLHAAGITTADGRVVVLVGPSGRGKTTAARVLGREFGYLSDETIAIDADGRVWPYRKPLSIIVTEGAHKEQRSASELGLVGLPDVPLTLAAILLLDRQVYAGHEPGVDVLDLDDALADLVEQSSYLTAMSDPLRTIARHASATGGIRRVTYREATSLIPAVRALLAGDTSQDRALEPSRPLIAEHLIGRGGSERAATFDAEPGGTRYFRAPVVDALALRDEPDRIAILREAADRTGVVNVLAGVAPAVWRAARGADLPTLVDSALSAYGAPEGESATVLVAAAVEELCAAGVLAVEQHWRLRSDVAWVDREQRAVVLSLVDPTATPVALEGSASAIWNALHDREWRSTSDVAERVADGLGLDVSEIRDDVASFLETLASSSLIACS